MALHEDTILLAHVTTDALERPENFIFSISNEEVPSNYSEVLSSPHRSEWQEAIRKEYLSLIEKGVFGSPCPLPSDRKATGNKLVLKNKIDSSGKLERRKARLTAQGFSQVPGVDYGITATYAPVAHMDSLRLFLALVASYDLECIHVDFVTAFLNSDLDETLFLKVPPGFNECQDRIHVPSGHVLPLRKAIYGLKQSNHLWNANIVESLTQSVGFTQLQTDKSIFVRHQGSQIQMILLYVDDCAIAAESAEAVLQIYHQLNEDYECNNLGDLKWLLGFEITRHRATRTISILQSQFIKDMAERFDYPDICPHLTPADLRHPTSDFDSSTGLADAIDFPYRSLVGCLLWIFVISRPDIGPALLHLCRFQSSPGIKHWEALLWLLGYVLNTQSLPLRLGGISPPDLRLVGWSDANYSKEDDCKSTSGYIVSLGGLGSISWGSKRQTITALSSTESEYMALAAAARQILWLRMMLSELRVPPDPSGVPTIIFCDNSATISLTKHDVAFNRTKHIHVRFHFLRDHVRLNEIQIKKVPSMDNRADQMTKFTQPLPLFETQRAVNLGVK